MYTSESQIALKHFYVAIVMHSTSEMPTPMHLCEAHAFIIYLKLTRVKTKMSHAKWFSMPDHAPCVQTLATRESGAMQDYP